MNEEIETPRTLPLWLFVGLIMVGCIILAIGGPIGIIALIAGVVGIVRRFIETHRNR